MGQVKFQYSNLNLSIIAYSRESRVQIIHTWCSKEFSRRRSLPITLPCKPLMVVDHPLGTTARGLSILKLILRRQLCTVRITCRLPCPTTRETQADQAEREDAVPAGVFGRSGGGGSHAGAASSATIVATLGVPGSSKRHDRKS